MEVIPILFSLIPLLLLILTLLTYYLHNIEASKTKNIEESLSLLNENMKALAEKLDKA